MFRIEPGQRAPRSDGIRSVMNALRRIVRDLRLSAREAERAAGISGAQLFVLQSLSEQRATSLNDLADRTFTDQSSVSVVVRKLTEKKLVLRKASRTDARRIELRVAGAGRKLLARCPEPTQERLLEALRRVSSDELSALSVGVAALVREMHISDAPPRMFFDDEAQTGRTRRGGRAARRDGP